VFLSQPSRFILQACGSSKGGEFRILILRYFPPKTAVAGVAELTGRREWLGDGDGAKSVVKSEYATACDTTVGQSPAEQDRRTHFLSDIPTETKVLAKPGRVSVSRQYREVAVDHV
jgi:hypothetical protein